MPLQKITFAPGTNKENTRYTNEGKWYDADKIRFRQGNPETIGGWARISNSVFLGVCRSLWNWITLGSLNLIGVGTNLKFYIEQGGVYNDVTPIRASSTINNNPFALTASTTVTVTDTSHGAITGDFVTFSGAVDIGSGGTNVTAAVLNLEFQITVLTANTYTITLSVTPNATAIAGSPGGGASVVAAYQISVGPEFQVPLVGWGAGGWGLGTWGNGVTSTIALRIWSQINFGEDLIFNPRGGRVYYWTAADGLNTRAVDLASVGDADTPVIANSVTVSDTSRFVIVFGTNDPYAISPEQLDPMLIRWSDQENPLVWVPAITNQAGSIRVSHGSQIITAIQTRQEIVVFTDSAVYSMQYLGPPYVWGSQLLGDNFSIYGQNAVALASGVVYWMGVDKFYMYDGRVQTLNCDLRRYIFNDINQTQNLQVFASTNEGFNEIWWFYCSAGSDAVDRYVVYNYLEKVWYYGTMARTAWLDSGLRNYPIAATYSRNIVNHEIGLNDNETGTETALDAYISSAEFDIGDGHNFGFVWRVLPDLTFGESTNDGNTAPQVTMTLYGLTNSGSGVTSSAGAGVVSSSNYVITEEFTGQIYTRLRGRQMIFKIGSNQLNTAWQLGAPRIDIRPDGRR
jgi:hypothetical protein